MNPKRMILLAALALLAPVAANAGGVGIEALYGVAWPPATDFDSAVGGVNTDHLSEDTSQIYGGTLLLNFGLLDIGAIVDTTSPDQGPDQTAIGGLAGLRFGDKLRFDLLGEIGGQRYGNVFENTDVVTESTSDQWLMYLGLRPGIAYRFGPSEGLGLVVGVWGFARWDVTDKKLSVDSGDAQGEVKLGGTTIGATLRAGIEF
ncbi:MAG: hypothetical protein QM767_11165 [Anaeromyxobacter sp.]